MTDIQVPPSESIETFKTEEPKQPNRGLFVVLAIVVAAIIGVGVWVIVDSNDSSGTALPDAATDTLDGYMAAGSDYDGEALISYGTGTYGFESYGQVENAEDHAATVTNDWERIGFKVERTGDRTISGSGSTYVVTEPETISWTGQAGIDGISVFNMIELNDTWMIDYHEWIPAGNR